MNYLGTETIGPELSSWFFCLDGLYQIVEQGEPRAAIWPQDKINKNVDKKSTVLTRKNQFRNTVMTLFRSGKQQRVTLLRTLLQFKFLFVKPGGISDAFYLHRRVQLGIGRVEPRKSLTLPYYAQDQIPRVIGTKIIFLENEIKCLT